MNDDHVTRAAAIHGLAGATSERIDGSGVLSIRDNGVGLSEARRSHDGMGLHIMHYRARAIDGSLSVTRRREGGTAVACAFPLPRPCGARGGPADALAES